MLERRARHELAWRAALFTLPPEQMARFQRDELGRFHRAVWDVWAATEGPRFPSLDASQILRQLPDIHGNVPPPPPPRRRNRRRS